MDPYVLLWNAPYAGIFAGIHKYAPSFVSPTFVIVLCALIVVQTALLGFSSAPLWTRALLLYLFLVTWVVLLTSLVTQVVCGKDIVRLGYTLLRPNEANETNEPNTATTSPV
jgi:hypothetical protein